VEKVDYSSKHLYLYFKPEYFTEFLREHPNADPTVTMQKIVCPPSLMVCFSTIFNFKQCYRTS
jgi:hypothetical protein